MKPSSHGGVLFMQGEAKLPPATPNTFNVHPTGLPWFLYNRLRIRRWLSWISFSLKTLRLSPFGLAGSGFLPPVASTLITFGCLSYGGILFMKEVEKNTKLPTPSSASNAFNVQFHRVARGFI